MFRFFNTSARRGAVTSAPAPPAILNDAARDFLAQRVPARVLPTTPRTHTPEEPHPASRSAVAIPPPYSAATPGFDPVEMRIRQWILRTEAEARRTRNNLLPAPTRPR